MYKKILTILSVLTLVFVTQSKAQLFVGIEGGANRNYLVSNTEDKPFFDYQPLNGFSVGVPIRYTFPKISWFGGIQVTPSYVQKNYMMERSGYYEPIYQHNYNNYLELPVMAQFRFGGNIGKTQSLHGILNLGGYTGYWLSGNIKGRTLSPMDPNNFQSYDESYTFSEEKDNRFEAGGLAGIGLQYMPNKKYVISIEGRYTASMTDQQKAYSENQTPRYNDTYSLLMSVQYQLWSPKQKGSNK
jgi:hypothetical protein